MPSDKKRSRKIGRPAGRIIQYGDQYQLRITDEDREVWTSLAIASGMSLSQWIRYHCAKAAGGTVAIIRAEFMVQYQPKDPA